MFVNENFSGWYQKYFPGERNDHGIWNGQNLNGLDPREILLAERGGKKFSLLQFRPQPDGAVPRAGARDQLSVCQTLRAAGPEKSGRRKGRRGRLRNCA